MEQNKLPSQNSFKFSVSLKCCLGSVNIYHLMITSAKNNQYYSYYFRCNSLLQIYNYSKSNAFYSKSPNFPPMEVFLQQNINLEKEFQLFFDALNSENNLNDENVTDIGKFLEVFGLSCWILLEMS